MGFGSKHIATFLLGAAAALAAKKYMDMTQEEKEKMISDLKEKAQQLKTDAEGATDKAKEYFEELKQKGGDALKEHMPGIESMLQDLFGNKKDTPPSGQSAKNSND
jgi:hypothetical protein